MIQFAWDPVKAAANLTKHRVAFTEAATVFDDNLALTLDDPDHSTDELRFVTFGLSNRGKLLIVAHTLPPPTLRLISARWASAKERRIYEEG